MNANFVNNLSLGCPEYNITTNGFSLVRAILFGIPASCIIVITVVGNFLVLCFRAKVGKRQTTLLIWNLGLADFLVGVVVLPMGVTYIISERWTFGWFLCKLWTACDVVFCTASIVTLCVISVDRYIGVTRPLRYKIIVTKRRVVVAIVIIWTFAISILLVTIRYGSTACYNPHVCVVSNELEYVVHSVISAFFFPAMVTLGLYYKIFKVAKRRERGLREGIMMLASNNNFLGGCVEPMRMHCGKDTVTAHRRIIKMHKKVSITLGVVVSAFLLCWCPFFTLYLINYHCDCVPLIFLDVLSWLGYCNSMVNPIIYAFTIQEFNTSLRNLLHGPVQGIRSFCVTKNACSSTQNARNITSQSGPRNRDYGAIKRCSSRNSVNMNHSPPAAAAVPLKPFRITECCSLRPSSKTSIEQQINVDFHRPAIEVSISSNDLHSKHQASVSEIDGTSGQPVWSAKLYTILVDAKVTGV